MQITIKRGDTEKSVTPVELLQDRIGGAMQMNELLANYAFGDKSSYADFDYQLKALAIIQENNRFVMDALQALVKLGEARTPQN